MHAVLGMHDSSDRPLPAVHMYLKQLWGESHVALVVRWQQLERSMQKRPGLRLHKDTAGESREEAPSRC